LFKAVVILSVILIVACSSEAAAQDAPSSASATTSEFAIDSTTCITVLAFLAAAHTHPVDAITGGSSELYAYFPDLTFRGISGLQESADMTIKDVLGRWCGEDIINVDLFTELSVLITSDPTFK
jgi:hypothetical protein